MMHPCFRLLMILYVSSVCAGSAFAGQLRVSVQDVSGKPLPDAVVLVISQDGDKRSATSTSSDEIDQVNKEFVPYVSAVRIGTKVSFPNKDDIRHHVYSFSPAKTFELPLYHGTPARPVVFDKKGIVKLGCNIHDWMLAYVYVTDVPYFGTTDADGNVVLEGFVPGTYNVSVWHPRMTGSEADTLREINLQGTVVLTWKLELRPEFRPPRASVPGGAEYQ